MMNRYIIALLSVLCLTHFLHAQDAKSEAAAKKARKARYTYFSTVPSKELKKDTLTMDSLLSWKSFYDTLGVVMDLKKLQGYHGPDSFHTHLIVIVPELSNPDLTYPYYEKFLGKARKKMFSKKEAKVREGDIVRSQRGMDSEGTGAYMIWTAGGDEPDASTMGELPDTTKPHLTLNEYLVWQLYRIWKYGAPADERSTTLCSDVLELKKSEFTIPMASFVGGTLRTNFLDPKTTKGNMSGSGGRSVKVFVPKAKKK